MRSLLLAFAFIAAAAGCALAQPQPPAGAKPITADSSVDDILDALDARGKDLHDFSGGVTLTETDAASTDSSTRLGKVVYQKKPSGDARILVTFDKREEGDGKVYTQRIDYLLDNGWLIDRDYKKQIEVNRQIVRPGEKIDLLKLGEGPFPLPIGQDKKAVHEAFDVSKKPAIKDDPPGTVHILLAPKPGTSLAKRFKTIDVHVDLQSHMPRRIETMDLNQTTIRSTDLDIKKINSNPPDAEFALPKISGDWNRHDEPFKD